MAFRDVCFTSDGIKLAGHLRLPAGHRGLGPAVVLTGPLSGVKEQVVGAYAERITAAAANGSIARAVDTRVRAALAVRTAPVSPAVK